MGGRKKFVSEAKYFQRGSAQIVGSAGMMAALTHRIGPKQIMKNVASRKKLGAKKIDGLMGMQELAS